MFNILRIAICDDELNVLSIVKGLIQQYEHTHDYDFDLFCYQSSMKMLDDLEVGQHFDLYILDIVMPKMTGMTLANHIRQYDESAALIFLTSSPEFALQSYDVSASSYLLKPVQPDKFNSAMDKALQNLTYQKNDCLVLYVDSKLVSISKHTIEYVEVRKDKLIFYLHNEEVLETYGTLHELQKQLMSNPKFIKPHRSYLVNMDYIKELGNKNIQVYGNFPMVPVSRTVYSTIKSAYLDYMVTMAGKGGIL